MDLVDVSVPLDAGSPRATLPPPFAPPQTCLTLACPPDLCPQHTPSASLHSFLPVLETLIHLSSSPGPKGVRLPGPAWRVLIHKGSYGVWDFKLPVSILRETRVPLKRNVAFLQRRQCLPASGAWLGWIFPDTPRESPSELGTRLLPPRRPFQHMVGGFLPPPLNTLRAPAQGEWWARWGVRLRQARGLRLMRGAPAVTAARRLRASWEAAFSPYALGWGEARTPKSPSRESGERSLQLVRRRRDTAGCKAPEVRAHCGASPAGGARGRPQRAAPRRRGVPAQLPAAPLTCCVCGSRLCTHTWGEDVCPQPAFAASPPSSTSSHSRKGPRIP